MPRLSRAQQEARQQIIGLAGSGLYPEQLASKLLAALLKAVPARPARTAGGVADDAGAAAGTRAVGARAEQPRDRGGVARKREHDPDPPGPRLREARRTEPKPTPGPLLPRDLLARIAPPTVGRRLRSLQFALCVRSPCSSVVLRQAPEFRTSGRPCANKSPIQHPPLPS